jgi:hypothetical protein
MAEKQRPELLALCLTRPTAMTATTETGPRPLGYARSSFGVVDLPANSPRLLESVRAQGRVFHNRAGAARFREKFFSSILMQRLCAVRFLCQVSVRRMFSGGYLN